MHLPNKRVSDTYEVGTPFLKHVEPLEVGSFEISPQSVRCDEPYILTVRYTVGPGGIATGGGVMIRAHGAQFEDAAAPNYLAVSCSRPTVVFRVITKGYPRIGITTPETVRENAHWHAAVLARGELREGDIVIFTVGTEAHPRSGPAKRRRFLDPALPIMVYLDQHGAGDYTPLRNSPVLTVLPGAAENLHAFLPSTVEPGARLVPRAATTTDRFGNVIDCAASVEVSLDGRNWTTACHAPDTGVIRPLARSPVAGIAMRHKPVQTTKNLPPGPVMEKPALPPVKVLAPGAARVFWGDMHFHSNFSCDVMVQGIENSPEDCYRYAQEASGLDFAVLTDHYHPAWRTTLPMRERGVGLSRELWEESKRVTERVNRPGEFVTFFGYEWRTQRGDTNLYFRDFAQAPYLPAQLDSLRRVRDYCANLAFFCAPHLHPYSHPYLTFGPWKWDNEVNAVWNDIIGPSEPVIEIFSRHGRYEFYGNQPLLSPKRGMTEGNSVQAHLLRGHRFGFYAGSDDHWGRPGQDGLIAVFATELTREAIFEAIQHRRCYATTNARILVDFTVNGHGMGAETFADEKSVIQAEIHGTAPLERVEIIRDGRIIHAVEPAAEDCTLAIQDEMAVLGTCFYYIRVLQKDQHMAWSSPVWVTSTRRIEDMHNDLSA